MSQLAAARRAAWPRPPPGCARRQRRCATHAHSDDNAFVRPSGNLEMHHRPGGAIHVFMLTFAKPSSSRLGAILPLNQPNKVRNRGAAAGAANKSTRSRAYRLAGRSLLGARLLPAMRLLALLLGVLGLFCPAQAQQCELTDGIVRFALCLLPLRPRSHTAVAHATRDARERP
jgi:hypothetical protein